MVEAVLTWSLWFLRVRPLGAGCCKTECFADGQGNRCAAAKAWNWRARQVTASVNSLVSTAHGLVSVSRDAHSALCPGAVLDPCLVRDLSAEPKLEEHVPVRLPVARRRRMRSRCIAAAGFCSLWSGVPVANRPLRFYVCRWRPVP